MAKGGIKIASVNNLIFYKLNSYGTKYCSVRFY